MVLVCMGIGWLAVQPRRSRVKEDLKLAQGPPPAPAEVKADVRPAAPEEKSKVLAKAEQEPEKPPPKEEPVARRAPAPAPAPAPLPRPAEPKAPPAPQLSYERDVLPIMQRACLSCHGAGRKRGGLDLRTFAALARGGESGPGVRPGRPADSPLWESVASGRMPPGKARKLTAAEKKTIRDWIASGARSQRGNR
jgi:hypothetical protein